MKKFVTLTFFLFLKAIKKFIHLKSKTKYTSPKQLVQQQKLTITKLKKKIKLNQSILPKKKKSQQLRNNKARGQQ